MEKKWKIAKLFSWCNRLSEYQWGNLQNQGGCLNLALRKKTEPISKHKHVNSDDDDNDDDNDYGYNDYVMKRVRPL